MADDVRLNKAATIERNVARAKADPLINSPRRSYLLHGSPG